MKSSDSLLGGFRFNDPKHRDTDPLRSVCRDYDQGTQQPVRTMRFESSPCDRLTVLSELKKGSAWKINIICWKVSGLQRVAKTLPLPFGYFRCLDHHLLTHPFVSFCAGWYGLSRLKPKQQSSYSLYRIFDKAYIRFFVCIS